MIYLYIYFFYIERTTNSTCCGDIRYFRSSATLFEDIIVKVPTFPDSVSEGDLRQVYFLSLFIKIGKFMMICTHTKNVINTQKACIPKTVMSLILLRIIFYNAHKK